MAEFTAYQSQKIGEGGPNAGLQYNVHVWFPDVAAASITEDIFTNQTQERLIIGMKILITGTVIASDKVVVVRAKKIGSSPSIFDPGVDLIRIFQAAGGNYGNGTDVSNWDGWTKRAGSSSAQIWVPIRFFMDKTMNLNINLQQFTGPSMQIHYLTGNPDRLMEKV